MKIKFEFLERDVKEGMNRQEEKNTNIKFRRANKAKNVTVR